MFIWIVTCFPQLTTLLPYILITCGIGHFELLFKARQVTQEQWLDIINVIMQLQAYLFDVIYVFYLFVCVLPCGGYLIA